MRGGILTPDEYMTDLAPRVAVPAGQGPDGPRPRKQLLVYNKLHGQFDQIAAPVDELRPNETLGAYRRRSFAADADSAGDRGFGRSTRETGRVGFMSPEERDAGLAGPPVEMPVSAVTKTPLRKIPPEGGERLGGAPYQPGPPDPGYKFIPSQMVPAPGDVPQLAHGQGQKRLTPDEYMKSSGRGSRPPEPDTLSRVQPELAGHARDIISSLAGQGYDVRIGDTVRTPEQQAQKVAQGVSRTYHSNHLIDPATGKSRALDLIVYTNGKPDWNTKNPAWRAIGKEAKSRGLGWGGDFQGLYDPGHIELRRANSPGQSDIDRYMAGQDVSPAPPASALPSPDAYMSDAAPGPRTSSKVVEDVDFSDEEKAQAAAPSFPQIALNEPVLTPHLMEKGTKINVSHGESLDPSRKYRVTIPVNQNDTSESLQLKGLYHVARSLGMDQAQAQVAAQDAYSHGPRQSFIAGTETPISDEDLAQYKKQGSTSFDFENPDAIKIYNYYIERGLTGPGQGLTANEMLNQRQLYKEIKDSPFKQGFVRGLGAVDHALGNVLGLGGLDHSDEFVKDAKRGERFASQVEAESPDQSFTAGLKRGAGAAIPQTAELLSLSKTRVPLAVMGALEHVDEGVVPTLKGAAQGEAMQLGMGATSKLLPPGFVGAGGNAAIWTGVPTLQAINQGKNPGEAFGEALPLGAMAAMGHDLGGEDARPTRIDLRGKAWTSCSSCRKD